jgi:predicted nucleotidyltransferase
MKSVENILKSFNVQKELNPKIWTEQDNRINPQVRQKLLEFAYQFIDSLDIDVVIDDIIVVGSIANYNWSVYSDIDLHILVDFKQFPKELKKTYIDFFDLKKIVFNQKRNVKMFGFDVEVFIEDIDMQGVSGGVYSLLDNEWVKKPKRFKMDIDANEVKSKTKVWMRLIDSMINNIVDEDIDTIQKCVKQFKDKLKKFRISGLQKGGEMSLENLVFKVLRRNGYIDKLYNVPTTTIDNKLSMTERKN